MPGVKPQLFTAAALTETDTFTTRVYPRNEFVQTDRIKTIRTAVTAPSSARTSGVSQIPVRAELNCKAQNIFWRLRVRPRRYSNWSRKITLRVTTKMSWDVWSHRPDAWAKDRWNRDLAWTVQYTGTSRPTSSRLSDYSLVKEQSRSAREQFAPVKERLYPYAAEL